MRLDDVDFDNEEQLKILKNAIVEVPVSVISFLLSYYYTGGGEPDKNSERLKEVLEYINSGEIN